MVSPLARLAAVTPETYTVEASGDPEEHVIVGDIMSPGTTDAVRRRILQFLAPLQAEASGR